MPTARPRLFTPEDAGVELGVARSTVYKWVDEGRLRAVRHPGFRGLRIRAEDIEAFLRSWEPVPPKPVEDGRGETVARAVEVRSMSAALAVLAAVALGIRRRRPRRARVSTFVQPTHVRIIRPEDAQ